MDIKMLCNFFGHVKYMVTGLPTISKRLGCNFPLTCLSRAFLEPRIMLHESVKIESKFF